MLSHDRAFLQRVVTDVVELDAHSRQATAFGGGWPAYLEARDIARRHAAEDHAAYAALGKRGQIAQLSGGTR